MLISDSYEVAVDTILLAFEETVRSEMEQVNDDEGKCRKEKWLSKMGHVIKNVTVEPFLAIFQLSMILSSLTTQNLNMRKACRVNLKMEQAVCFALENKNTSAAIYKDEEVTVQRLVAGMMVWQNVIQNAVPCALVVFVGSWSDRNRRRKPFMLIPVFGELVRNAGLIACVYFFSELSMEVAGIVESVPSSITGSLPVLMLAVFAYVGDISTVSFNGRALETLSIGKTNRFENL